MILGRDEARTGRVEARTDDGWILRGERRGDPRAAAVVVLGHAMMVDRRTLDRPRGEGLASALVGGGLEVVSFDARGHGESGPGAAEGARWDYDDVVRFDVPAMVRAGRSIARGRPVALLGHSLVGHAAMIAAGLSPDDAPDAIVAYAPNLWDPELEPSATYRAVKGGALLAWDLFTRARGYFDPAPFGLGRAAEASPYVRQFHEMWRHGIGDRARGIDYREGLARARAPMLVYASENDRLLARVPSVERYAGLASGAEVEVRVLRGDDAPDHAGFVTDPRSRRVWEATASWIRHRLGA